MMNTNTNIKVVIKRDGITEQPFDAQKIVNAVCLAFKDIEGEVSNSAQKLAESIATIISQNQELKLKVEDIQDEVEELLMSSHRKDVAKAYIQWRYKRGLVRLGDSTDSTILNMLEGKNEYWTNENSNKNVKVQNVRRDYIAGIQSESISRRLLIEKHIMDAHDEGIIHLHDLDYYIQNTYNCCLLNLEDMLENGTVMNGVKIDRPRALRTAFNLAAQFVAAGSSCQYGGITITLSHLAPFVEESRKRYRERFTSLIKDKDELEQLIEEETNKEIKDSCQILNYQLNTLYTSNGQAPFVSICMYLGEVEDPKTKDDLAKIIYEFLKQRIQGFKNEQGVWITPAFPKLLYFLEEDNIHPDSKYYYLTLEAAKCTSKRLVPDYISEKMMKKLKKGNAYPCMGCRSFLTPDETTENYAHALNWKQGSKKYYGRFNQGVTTLNLPDVALSAKREFEINNINNQSLDEIFWRILDERTKLCYEALKARHDRLETSKSDVAPIMFQHGGLARLGKGESIKELLYHGYSTISLGYAGLYECVKVMTGESQAETKGKEFGLKVMKFLNDKCNEWWKETDIKFSCYGTPIESTTLKFAKCLKKRFGDDVFIKIDGNDRNYITNSYHITPKQPISPFEKLSIEAEFQALSPGGCISYIECADLSKNIPAVLQIIQFIYDNIMYAELNTTTSYCFVCKEEGQIELVDKDNTIKWRCKNCGNDDFEKMNCAYRCCGYISSQSANQGRLNDVKDRYVHLDDHNECCYYK